MFTDLIRGVRSAVRDSRGATAVEYAIMVGFIAVVIVAGVALLGQAVLGLFAVPAGL